MWSMRDWAEDGLLTVAEYEALSGDDRFVDELSRGRLVREPRPGYEHSLIVSNVIGALHSYIRANPHVGRLCSESGFMLPLGRPTVRSADAAVILSKNLPMEIPTSFFVGAPDIAIEVISPSNKEAEMHEKVLEYLEAGTCVIWLLYPRTRTAVEYLADVRIRMLNAQDFLRSELLPGFVVVVNELFD